MKPYKQWQCYKSWRAMTQRCTDPNSKVYKRYGGRGIKVCERWLDFDNFLADMGERPDGMTLDRFPNNTGNYEPGNCRWATSRAQRVNQSSRLVPIAFEGRTLLLTEWAKETGISAGTIYQRLFYRHWSTRDALTLPPHHDNRYR